MEEQKDDASLDFNSKADYSSRLKDKKKQKRKERRQKKKNVVEERDQPQNESKEIAQFMRENDIKIEYVPDESIKSSSNYDKFASILSSFYVPKTEDRPQLTESEDSEESEEEIKFDRLHKKEKIMTKKQIKNSKRMKISELKMITDKPEIVEAWDVTAKDPLLLLSLKRIPNTVPVPKHWNQKRKFLQNKRGFLKPPLELPDFIEDTGISKIRDNTVLNTKSLKSKMKERMQPKLGRMDIDYQTLHDAFFKYQRKPRLTRHGDLYYENKEYSMKMSKFRPGRLSEQLRNALGISEGSAPPWIINMQRYGPPPTYPNLKIPGVNAPLCDPTADITPNLWKEPTNDMMGELIYGRNKESNHWGDLVQEEEEFSDVDEDVSIDSKEDFNIETFNTGEFENRYKKDFDNAIKQGEDYETGGMFQAGAGQVIELQPVVNKIKDSEIFGSSVIYKPTGNVESSADLIDDEIERQEKELRKAKKEMKTKLKEKF